MINSVHMKFFRQHKDLSVEFNFGLNVLRGPNEGGKTTILEAVTYTFWGAKALRDTLAETVTWGQKESALWVQSTTTFAGIQYVFTRSKAGAEVNYVKDGVALKVVGQSEVTAFASELLGVDAAAGAALILATQSDLRGALEAGPTAASGLMAKMADFDLIDRLVKAAQDNLVLGAEKPVRERLTQAQVDEANVTVPTETKADYYDALRANAQHQLDAEQAKEPDLAAAVEAATVAVQGAIRQNEAHAQAERAVQQTNQHVENLFASLRMSQAVVDKRPTPGLAVEATKALADAQKHGETLSAYNLVRGLPTYPEAFWEGSKEGFDIEMQALATKLAKADADHRDVINQQARTQERRLTGNGKCPTCGAEKVSQAHIDEHNGKIDVELNDLKAKRGLAKAALDEVNADITAMKYVQTGSRPFELAAKTLSNRGLPVKVDEEFYPPKVTWVGDAPVAVDLKKLQSEVDRLNRLHKDADAAEGQVKMLTEQIQAGQKKLEEALMARGQNTLVDVTSLEEARNLAVNQHRAQLNVIGALMTDVQNFTRERDECVRQQADMVARKAAAEQLVITLRRELDDLIFNNALVAKLRTLKPKITDDLWNKVLSAVSSFFSNMRDETSVVTKAAKGFKVNDRSIDSLSGSTLDILAVATRVAMTKTFIPQATFIILDEPAHGCDVMRTSKLLGFLASVGFDQVILASHDELSEAVADNVVALGG